MINKKIDLLLISLEILNIYFIKNQNTLEFNKIRKDLKKNNFSKHHRFVKLIKQIYIIHLIIDKYLLNEIANEILKNYSQSKKCNSISKYRKKFYKIYCEQKEYYKNYKLLNSKYKVDIKNIALINLYIISKSIKKDGIYFLIKYLLN
uniref:hypothetical protein n=1 Tax=Echinothamnion hystrix TaxID=1917029 RepID=UPI002551D542|nr:hypothetical protein QQP89_pgp008 [Echinothamnion hystrix]WGH14598.1 hypothetical protein [Echinothamnion hystrix]